MKKIKIFNFVMAMVACWVVSPVGAQVATTETTINDGPTQYGGFLNPPNQPVVQTPFLYLCGGADPLGEGLPQATTVNFNFFSSAPATTIPTLCPWANFSLNEPTAFTLPTDVSKSIPDAFKAVPGSPILPTDVSKSAPEAFKVGSVWSLPKANKTNNWNGAPGQAPSPASAVP